MSDLPHSDLDRMAHALKQVLSTVAHSPAALQWGPEAPPVVAAKAAVALLRELGY